MRTPPKLRRDLLNVALVLGLLRADLNRHHGIPPRGDRDGQLNGYEDNLARHKAVLDDLLDLGRSGSSWVHQPSGPVEISAYVLDSLRDDSKAVGAVVRSGLPSTHDGDSGVSDVDSEGAGSPSHSGSGFPDGALAEQPAAELLLPENPFFPDDLRDADLDNLDSFDVASRWPKLDGDDVDPPSRTRDVNLATTFAPDEEDVENQLMHIDDRLIGLDGSIEDINDNFQHLDEALVAADEDIKLEDEEDFLSPCPSVVHLNELCPFDRWETVASRHFDDLIDVSEFQPETAEALESDSKTDPQEQTVRVDGATSQLTYSDDDSKLGTRLEPYHFSTHLSDHSYAASPTVQSFESSIKVEEDSDVERRRSDGPEHSYHCSLAEGASLPPSSSTFFSKRSRESRDERKVRELGIPFTLLDLVDSTVDKFNDLLSTVDLTKKQVALCRDVRRRGKNKVAAQNSRQRKLDLIGHLTEEVNRTRVHKRRLLAEREQLYRMRNEWTDKLLRLEEQVLRGLDKSADEYTLELMSDCQEICVTRRRRSVSAFEDPSVAGAAVARCRLAKPTKA